MKASSDGNLVVTIVFNKKHVDPSVLSGNFVKLLGFKTVAMSTKILQTGCDLNVPFTIKNRGT